MDAAPGSSAASAKTDIGVSLPPHAAVTYMLAPPRSWATSRWAWATRCRRLDLLLAAGLGGPRGRAEDRHSGPRAHPTVAFRPSRYFALGGSFRYLPTSVYLKRPCASAPPRRDGGPRGHGLGIGAAAGASSPFDGLSLASPGARPPPSSRRKSDFRFPPPFDPQAVDRDAKARCRCRRSSAGHRLRRRAQMLNVSADVEYQMWSTFKSLDIRLQNADGTETISSSPRDSTNGWVVHAGAELRLSNAFMVRAATCGTSSRCRRRT